jgi:nucleoside-diphosphate kinase
MADVPAAFIVTYTEPMTKAETHLQLSFWSDKGEVALYDPKARRTFLRRCVPTERLTLGSIYIGATIIIAARPFKVIDYADANTRRIVGSAVGATPLIVLPHAYAAAGKVLTVLRNEGINVGRVRMVRFTPEEAAAFVAIGSGGGGGAESEAEALLLSSEHCLAIECTGEDILARVHAAIGPADPPTARSVAPRSVRALLGGANRAAGVVRGARNFAAGAAEINFLFEVPRTPTAVATHCAVAIVKPHAVAQGLTGDILDALLGAGLEVSAARSIVLTRADAADYLEPYKGVAVEYERWVQELSSAPAVAFEVRAPQAVEVLRELAGPYDIAVARELRPRSLRALYGTDNVLSAIHVTDVDVDGPLESKFIFHVLP